MFPEKNTLLGEIQKRKYFIIKHLRFLVSQK